MHRNCARCGKGFVPRDVRGKFCCEKCGDAYRSKARAEIVRNHYINTRGLPDSLPGEVWKDVVGYEGYYKVSSHGRVMGCDRCVVASMGKFKGITFRRLPSLLKQELRKDYPHFQVKLCRHNRIKSYFVHILVCRAFNGEKPIDKPVVAHWDGDGLNNYFENLRWASHLENEEDKLRHHTRPCGSKHKMSVFTDDQVREIFLESWLHTLGRSRPCKRGFLKALAEKHGSKAHTINYITSQIGWRHITDAVVAENEDKIRAMIDEERGAECITEAAVA